MSNSIALISLVVLIAVIAVGFVMKKNVGLIAVLAAWIFGAVIGTGDSDIIKGFSSSTFIMLLGVSLLCTAHAGSLEELKARPLYRRLLDEGLFRRLAIIERAGRERRYQVVELC